MTDSESGDFLENMGEERYKGGPGENVGGFFCAVAILVTALFLTDGSDFSGR